MRIAASQNADSIRCRTHQSVTCVLSAHLYQPTCSCSRAVPSAHSAADTDRMERAGYVPVMRVFLPSSAALLRCYSIYHYRQRRRPSISNIGEGEEARTMMGISYTGRGLCHPQPTRASGEHRLSFPVPIEVLGRAVITTCVALYPEKALKGFRTDFKSVFSFTQKQYHSRSPSFYFWGLTKLLVSHCVFYFG